MSIIIDLFIYSFAHAILPALFTPKKPFNPFFFFSTSPTSAVPPIPIIGWPYIVCTALCLSTLGLDPL